MEFEERIVNAVNALGVIPFGSLWLVKDVLWETVIPDFVRKRKGHPGLVFREKKYQALDNVVPMLIGTSKRSFNCKSLPIKGVMAQKAKNKKDLTYFSIIRPVNTGIKVGDFVLPGASITRNTHKPSLDSNEVIALRKYIRRCER